VIDSYNERGRGGRFLEREGRGEGGEGKGWGIHIDFFVAGRVGAR
jgi:hypothetical protein